ncbi:YbbR-like domain-containing protein [bacterium]|nr:YbbR-like domain-containing protein [bacterium]
MDKIRSLLFKNLTLKILSLILASGLWFFISGKSKTELALSATVEFTALPSEMTIVSKVPTNIHIRVKGTKTLLRPLTIKPPSISIDMSHAKSGKNIIQLAQEKFNDLPLGVDVVNLDPETLTLYLDRFVNVSLAIKLKTQGTPPKGFQIKEISVSPQTAEFKVSEKYLKENNTVFTEPLNLGNLRKSTKINLQLLTPPGELKLINPEIEITATITISEAMAQRVIKGIRIDFKNRDKGIGRIGISNYFVDLVVECPLLMQVDNIRKATSIAVDLESLKTRNEYAYYTFPVQVSLPKDVKLLAMDPTEVEIVLKKPTP